MDVKGKVVAAADMDYAHLEIGVAGAVAHVTMNRPDRLNALDPTLIASLCGFFTDLAERPQIRVVVLTGAGRAFCAGLDLKHHNQTGTPETVSTLLDGQRRLRNIIPAMRRCPQPIVALLNGAASGAGFAIALGADVRLALPTARMNAAFIRLGASACDMGVSYFLPRMIGTSAAAHYLLTGRFIDAERARDLGLVSFVGDQAAVDEEVRSLCADMLAATPLGLRLTKDALNHSIDMSSLEAVIAMEDRNQILSLQGEDFDEGVRAFLEKRRPVYKGS